MSSNLRIRPNLILEEKASQIHRFVPGDLAKLIYRSMTDVRARDSYFTPTQIIEMDQILVCTLCLRPCAGTCVEKE